MANILVIDPSRSMRSTLKERLEYEGYKVEVAEDTISGMTVCGKQQFDLMLCGQPDSPIRTSTPWIRLSHDSSTESAVTAMQQGAADFITKPINMNRLLEAVKRSLAQPKGAADTMPADSSASTVGTPEEIAVPAKRSSHKNSSRNTVRIIGKSAKVCHMNKLIDKVSCTDARVLIMGDNGTGKELVARKLHANSSRSNGPFIEVNCAAIPSELIESELFGHEKGAFTSAVKQRKGKFEQANNGTLFLDEIGDMSLAAQAKVLRVLQERKITRVGSDRDIEINVRVLAATNKDIPKEIVKGEFREDLYHRLSVIVIRVPALSERLDDIPLLVDHFMEELCQEYGVPEKKVTESAIAALQQRSWSGNIRELRNVVERMIILCGDTITEEDVELYADGF